MRGGAVRPLSLDHITVVDATPSQLAGLAAETGCAGMCLFLHPMAVLPGMPDFALIGDTPERRATRDAMRAGGVALDLAYPFTLAGRTDVVVFEPVLETAAWLGGRLANVLCYDREPARRIGKLAALAELAGGYGIGLAVEFYPPSQVRSLHEALALIEATGRDDIGVTLDLLHLHRAGEMPGALPLLADPRIRIAQVSDGPLAIAPDRIEWEAGSERLLPGEGAFDIDGFVAALAPECPVSVEVPRQSALDAGRSMLDRARRAVEATRAALGETFHG
ncbi:sugar phosphate isomerase/epimerase [Sphingomonas sp. CL5.1]|uniref:sugar phosphate isomerase/epimerase family protein n=1 Tax=Sphingomonas sp. CL5.1 TaxID=2653203 RepID=UPI0015834696|nr:sugar phosphate isomerase/epimerase [Sphingomonas sp. CL5.1]QKS01440.1 sugar phosphate isomerase/epimerase [Sphingomonas sp. CL5.1]